MNACLRQPQDIFPSFVTTSTYKMPHLHYKVIKNRHQYNDYCKRLEDIMFSDQAEERVDEIELLTLLIETYDAEQRESENSDPVTLIKALMEEHKLNQNDLAGIVHRSKGYVSEILNRKKALSKDVIRSLAHHFKISQDALNKEYELNNQAPTIAIPDGRSSSSVGTLTPEKGGTT
jgi:HTH-type transcriptional regulator/antitoxin HigA